MCPSNLFFRWYAYYKPTLYASQMYRHLATLLLCHFRPESRHNVTLLLLSQVYLIGTYEKPPPQFSVGMAVLLCKVSQIFFHILILNAVYYLAFPSIKDELSGDRAVAVLGLGAFLLVD